MRVPSFCFFLLLMAFQFIKVRELLIKVAPLMSGCLFWVVTEDVDGFV